MNQVKVVDQKGTFILERDLLSGPRKFSIHLLHVPSGKQIPLGDFEVMPSASIAPEIVVAAWGPQSTFAGKGFNLQKNGTSGIWFKIRGGVTPTAMEAWFGNTRLEKFRITSDVGGAMQIPPGLIANKGEYPVYLVHKQSKKRYIIGKFIVK